jgi:hypothetical protein
LPLLRLLAVLPTVFSLSSTNFKVGPLAGGQCEVPGERLRAVLGNVKFREIGFAQFWGSVPELCDLNEVDAMKVSHRHACYKHLINSASTGGETLFGEDSQHHWLWAYSAQLDWQDRSRRLNPSSSSSVDDGAISPDSWWQIMNFMFSICVLQGAVDAGLVATPVNYTEDTEAFLEKPAVQACTQSWREFWEYDHADFAAAAATTNAAVVAKEASKSWGFWVGDAELKELQALRDTLQRKIQRTHELAVASGSLAAMSSEALAALPPEVAMDLLREELQRKVWWTHKVAMESGLAVSSEALAALPPDEAKFGLGWVKVVELLASVVWRTDLATLLRNGIGYLPSKRLVPGALEVMKEEAPKEHAAVRSAMRLSGAPRGGLRLASAFWRRVARWKGARRRMPATLDNLTYDKKFLPLALARLVGLATAPRSLREAAGWLVLVAAVAVAAKARHGAVLGFVVS